MLPASRVTGRRMLTGFQTVEAGVESLQEQSPRHQVQLVRGAAAPGPAGRAALSGPGRRDRARHPGRGEPARHRTAGRLVRRHRPQPAGLRPGHRHGPHSRGVQALLPCLHGRAVVAARGAIRARRHGRAPVAALGRRRTGARVQPGHLDVRERPVDGAGAVAAGHAGAEAFRRAGGGARLDLDHGADRAGRRLRCGRRPQPGRSPARRHLAHRGREAVHHLRRARHGGEHLPPRPRPPGGPRARYQGAVHVPGAQVPGRPRRHAGRAQRG